jgi:hypothetical protein
LVLSCPSTLDIPSVSFHILLPPFPRKHYFLFFLFLRGLVLPIFFSPPSSCSLLPLLFS